MPIDLGERFARTVAAQDADALKNLLAPKVSFRALTPGRYWESDDADAVVDDVILGTWFSPERSITRILTLDCATLSRVGHVDRVDRSATGCRQSFPTATTSSSSRRTSGPRTTRSRGCRFLCSGFVHDA